MSVSVNFSFQRVAPASVIVAPCAPVVMPAPVVAPAPVVIPQPVVTLPQEVYGYAPPLQTALPPGVVFQGVLSTRSEVAPRTAVLGDGIEVKVRKVRDDPYRADLEIRIGDFEETYKRLPIGSRISLRGWSGQLYHIDLVDVGYRAEMVTIIVTR